MGQFTILVTGAGGPLGVNFTRSIRKGDPKGEYRIIGTDANRWHLPLSLCDETYLIPMAKEHDGYRRAIAEITKREKVQAIIPTHPVEVRAVAELRDKGALGELGTCLPRTHILDVTDDKAATQRILHDIQVPVPKTILLHGVSDLERAFDEYRSAGPLWVRGSGAPGLGIGGAALPCTEIGVAKAWIEHHNGWGKMAASEYLPGDNLTWMAAFCHGKLVACAARERLEYVLPHVSPSGITGAPAVSRTIFSEELFDIGERSVRAVDDCPHGVYFVDMKGDGQNKAHVTEINGGRCGTTIHFYTEAGYNFPLLLVKMVLGENVDHLVRGPDAISAGKYWIRTLDCGPVLVRDESGFDAYPKAGF